MLISINAKIIEGAWGGGNQFVKYLIQHLRKAGHEVIFSLKSPKIDLILMIHPNKYPKIRDFGINEIKSYLYCHHNTVLVQRVNTSDERKGSNDENEMILEANRWADYTVFISTYLRDFYVHKGFDPNRLHQVILNGADEKIFNPAGRADWKPEEKLKIVTHHWSNNYMKGFDIYERLDLLLGTEPFCNLFEFTVIGNIPKGLNFNHTRTIPPISGQELAQVLKINHIYLTASRNEPAGMHHIEGMRCGLPVLYLNSGALPEYCSPFGIEFNLINFEKKLLEMRDRYLELRQKVLECPYTGKWMATQYEELFTRLVNERQANPLPDPGLGKVLKQCLIKDPLIKIKQLNEKVKKLWGYLK